MRKLQFRRRIQYWLAGHAWLGIGVGALLYLLCVTGTLAVFGDTLRRWEHPDVPEYRALPPVVMGDVEQEFIRRAGVPETLWLLLPTPSLPRAHVSDGEHEWYLDVQGQFVVPPTEPWVELLTDLHIHLQLPQTLGLVVVGVLGVLMASLIISGLLAHPAILRNAFQLRWGGSQRVQHADIHNRIGVWATPFLLMVSLTGAFIGLASLYLAVWAELDYGGDRSAAIEAVYGADPMVDASPSRVDYPAVMAQMARVAPAATPIYLAVQGLGTENQVVEVAATLPQRLAYSEIYRFSVDGRPLGDQGLTSGPWGRQLAYSVYRLHFGHFGGAAVRWLYLVFGAAAIVLVATGMRLWLVKRAPPGWIGGAWTAVQWGTPAGLACAAASALVGGPVKAVFWLVFAGAAVVGVVSGRAQLLRQALLGLCAAASAAVAALHLLQHGLAPSGAALLAQLAWVVLAMGSGWALIRRHRETGLRARPRQSAVP